MTDTIIQIVPSRGIAPEGVGDYARIIAERLLADHDLRTIFVAGTPLPMAERLHDSWETHHLDMRSSAALSSILARFGQRGRPILLHYSGYGFQGKGVPLWVARGMQQWRQANPATALVGVFHEIYATGPMTGSAFWLSALQKSVARRLLSVSTGALATTEPYTARLRNWARGAPPVINMPVFSTIGETDDCSAASARAPEMVVFGRPGIHDAIYVRKRDTVEAFIAAQGIRRVIDIGARTTPPPATLGGAVVEPCGELPPAAIRERVARARFGLLDYNADRLAKSTIFAAYCAQGAIPVCLSDEPGYTDGLTPGGDYMKLGAAARMGPLDAAALDALQTAAMQWYRPHALRPMIDTVHGLLEPSYRAEG